MSDFAVAVRIVGSDATTIRADLNDIANGLSVETVQEPDDAYRRTRTTSPRVDGEITVAEVDDASDLNMIVTVEGNSWTQVVSRWQAVRTAYRAEARFYLDVEVEGVTTRYSTERPDVSSAGIEAANLMQKRQTYSLRFRVQPNPSVTI